MQNKLKNIWPEIEWIKNEELKEKVYKCWEYAIDKSPLSIDDLEKIPFSLLIDECNVSFMNHKRTVVQLSVEIAKIMENNFKDDIKINWDYMIAGAILIDVGKLLEYEKVNNKITKSKNGELVRHTFSGTAIADRFDLPAEVQHIIAYHSKEGDLGKRTIESIIVHHADFVSFEPFKESSCLRI